MSEGRKFARLWVLTAVGVLFCVSTLGSADRGTPPPLKAAVDNDLFNPETQVLKRGRRDINKVCLTFDDGPYPESLPRILEVLRKHGAKATFFMVGKRMLEHPELVRQVLSDG